MLLNFRMNNFRSFRDETVFTMLSSMQKTHNDYVINKTISGNNLKVLPLSVIYGANASGKSNIIFALYVLKKIVTAGNLDSKDLAIYKNALSFIRDLNWYEPIEMEITFATETNIFRYGIEFTDMSAYEITNEYLFINDNEIFTRDSEIHMPISSLVKKGFIAKNEEDFANILLKKINYTLNKTMLVVTGAISNIIDENYFADFKKWFDRFNVIMNANDMDFRQKDLELVTDRWPGKDQEVRRKLFKSKNVDEIVGFAEFGNQKINFVSDADQDEISMCSEYEIPDTMEHKPYSMSIILDSDLMESKGTIHLIRLIQPFVDALENGGVVVLDEMDASLHFEIVVSLIRIFNSRELNKKGAQLIFNTHNPIYFDGELLRHDQIVMVEKNKADLTSSIYSLSDYKLRPEERILKNYLAGKYGALPHMDLEIAFKHILEREES